MTPAQFARVREILLEALDLPLAERAGFVDARCAHDPALGRIATRLLAHGDPRDGSIAASDLPELPELPERLAEDLPERIGRYRVLRRLGSGGMGIVYLGLDPDLNREVAIKTLPGILSRVEPALDRFRREARILARLNHPNIATIFSLEQDGDLVFLTMEWIQGETLAVHMERGPMGLDAFLPILRQIACALEAAHGHGVIHRDLKPANVLVTREGFVKVLDFGIAKLASDPQDEDDPGPIGTPGYMSPEQIRDEPIDARADLWSFGCILHEGLAGEPAFGGAPGIRVRSSLETDYDPSRLPDGVPSALREMTRRLLARDPRERPLSAAAARRTLDEVVETQEIARVGDLSAVHLPLYLTRFIGREAESIEIRGLLDERQLVTLTGPGGCGKTRLAVEVARTLADRFPDGIRFADLASARDAGGVPRRIAFALGLDEGAVGDPRARIRALLASRKFLLILDNCEHQAAACGDLVMSLLESCPALRILATSRGPLGVDGESILRIPPLGASGRQSEEAVDLFLDRAGPFVDAKESHDAIREICRRLDGLPLAIELAATWASILSPETILGRLDRRLELPAAGSTPRAGRHRSLRATIDGSYEALAPEEKALFRALAIFRGGCTLEALETVCIPGGGSGWRALDLVRSLAAKSLLERSAGADPHGGPRYRMLETIHEYAAEKLGESGEGPAMRRAHFSYFANLFSGCDLKGAEQGRWAARFREEEENLRAAFEDDPAASSVAERAALAARLADLWILLGRWEEGRRICAGILEAIRASGPLDTAVAEDFVRVAVAGVEMARHQGELLEAETLAAEALAAAERTGDPELLAMSSNALGRILTFRGKPDEARRLFDAFLARLAQAGDPWNHANLLFNRGVALFTMERPEEATADFRECLRAMREVGDPRGIALALNALGRCFLISGELDEARRAFEESLAIKREIGDRPGIVTTLLNLGLLETDALRSLESDSDRASLRRARRGFEEALELTRTMGDRPNEARLLLSLGHAAFLAGDHDAARRRFEEGLRVPGERHGYASSVQLGLGHIALRERRLDAAREHASAALASARREKSRNVEAEALEILGAAEAASGRLESAIDYLARASRIRGEIGIIAPLWAQEQVRRLIEDLTRSMGRPAFEAAWARGRQPPPSATAPP